MEYRNFLDDVKNGVQRIVGEDGKVQIVQVDKNNGIKLDGLVIKGMEKNISPAISLNVYYEQYKSGRAKADIVNEIYQISHKYSCHMNIGLEDFCDYGRIGRRVAYKIVNLEKNRELLADIPYVKFLDMAIIFFVLVQCRENHRWENATFLIRDEHLKMWNVDVGEVYRDALYNTPELFPAQISDMEEMITEMLSEEMGRHGDIDKDECEAVKKDLQDLNSESHTRMYVLTNSKKLNGAACLLYKNVLKEFSGEKGENFYIIPSSIHEVLLVPEAHDLQVNELRRMVKDVNDSELDEEEILSDNIYYYDYKKDKIRFAACTNIKSE